MVYLSVVVGKKVKSMDTLVVAYPLDPHTHEPSSLVKSIECNEMEDSYGHKSRVDALGMDLQIGLEPPDCLNVPTTLPPHPLRLPTAQPLLPGRGWLLAGGYAHAVFPLCYASAPSQCSGL